MGSVATLTAAAQGGFSDVRRSKRVEIHYSDRFLVIERLAASSFEIGIWDFTYQLLTKDE